MNEHERVARWLAKRIAERQGMPEQHVGWSQPFSELGLASLDLVGLAVELGAWLGRDLDTTLLFNRPNVEQVAQAVSEAPNSAEAGAPLSAARQEPVAIVGLACRFPGAPDADAFWRLLRAGGEAIVEVPAWRWGPETYQPGEPCPGKSYVRSAGFVEGIDEFDAAFFGISAREARVMDPQHRLVLMTAWHALEDAGIPPARLAATRTGVFIGIGGASDYFGVMEQAGVERDAYFGTGVSTAIAANRLSFLLDLRGPSFTIDTTCSSSLVAVHQARASLLSGESEAAIVAGVNVIVCAGGMVTMSQSRMLSPTARCHTFDEKADGYVRGEGCGVVILKRFSDALRDGDRIHALIVGTAMNQDGRSAGLTVPNGEAQARLMRDALAAAALAPGRVGYLEAHGTGTPLGDPIEMGAIKQVYGQPSDDEPALLVGSVKTNVGHLEAAAGMAGLIKVVLAMRYQEIPTHRNFERLNPRISLDGTRCEIARAPQGWPMSLRPRYASVSSFGIGGTNAHAVLQDAPATGLLQTPADEDPAPDLFVLSGRDADALVAQAQRHAEYLAETEAPWAALCHTAAARRAHHPERLAVVASSASMAARSINRWIAGDMVPEVHTGLALAQPGGKLAFLFTGQGAQYVGMGRELYRRHAGFMQALQRCDAVLQPLTGQSVLSLLYPQDEAEVDLSQTVHAQPTLFALEYALAQVWLQAGVKPDAVLGHSLGEYVAACVAGIFSLEDALTLVVRRARLMQDSAPPGAMAAVQGSPELLERLLAQPRHSKVAPAARNTAREIVMSGDAEALQDLLAQWRKAGATATSLQVTRGFHSPLMEEMAVQFTQAAEAIRYQAPHLPIVSNVSGALAGEEMASAAYWVRHTLAPVAFQAGIDALTEMGCTRFVEIGPHPVLCAYVRQIQPRAVALPSLRRGRCALQALLEGFATWHVGGGAIAWDSAHAHRTGDKAPPLVVPLPLYAFRRDRHWFVDDDRPAPQAANPGRALQNDPLVVSLRAGAPATLDQIEDYLFRCVAHSLRMSPRERDSLRPRFRATSLNAAGVDSLMAVELRETLRADLAVDIPIRALLDGRPAAAIAQQLCDRLGAGAAGWAGDIPWPTAEHDAAGRFAPFPLSGLGRSVWEAAQAARPAAPNELYCELDLDGDDFAAVEAAWDVLVRRHDMLRAEVTPEGSLRVLPEVPSYRIDVMDVRTSEVAQQEALLLQRRAALSQAVLRTDRWPLFDVRITAFGDRRMRMHMAFSVLLVDTQSFAVLAAEWMALSDAGSLAPPPAITYRDYQQAVRALQEAGHPLLERSRDYWQARQGALPPGPDVRRPPRVPGEPGRYASLQETLHASDWQTLQNWFATVGLTPSAALLAVYVDVLRAWSRSAEFSLGVVASHRLPVHPQIGLVVGDFAEWSVLVVDGAPADRFEDRARALQSRLFDDLEHLHFSAIGMVEGGVAGFLFNSMLHATSDSAEDEAPALFGNVVYTLTRGAGTRLEMQVTEDAGALKVNWDTQLDTFLPGEPEQHFAALVRRLRELANDAKALHQVAHIEEVLP